MNTPSESFIDSIIVLSHWIKVIANKFHNLCNHYKCLKPFCPSFYRHTRNRKSDVWFYLGILETETIRGFLDILERCRKSSTFSRHIWICPISRKSRKICIRSVSGCRKKPVAFQFRGENQVGFRIFNFGPGKNSNCVDISCMLVKSCIKIKALMGYHFSDFYKSQTSVKKPRYQRHCQVWVRFW